MYLAPFRMTSIWVRASPPFPQKDAERMGHPKVFGLCKAGPEKPLFIFLYCGATDDMP